MMYQHRRSRSTSRESVAGKGRMGAMVTRCVIGAGVGTYLTTQRHRTERAYLKPHLYVGNTTLNAVTTFVEPVSTQRRGSHLFPDMCPLDYYYQTQKYGCGCLWRAVHSGVRSAWYRMGNVLRTTCSPLASR